MAGVGVVFTRLAVFSGLGKRSPGREPRARTQRSGAVDCTDGLDRPELISSFDHTINLKHYPTTSFVFRPVTPFFRFSLGLSPPPASARSPLVR